MLHAEARIVEQRQRRTERRGVLPAGAAVAAAGNHLSATLASASEINRHNDAPARRPSASGAGLRWGQGADVKRSAASAADWPDTTPQAAASGLARLMTPRRSMSSPSPMRALPLSTAAMAMPCASAQANPLTPAWSRPMPASLCMAARAPALAER
jgi:hypothetical protein